MRSRSHLKPQGDIYHYDVMIAVEGRKPENEPPHKDLCIKVLTVLIANLKQEFPDHCVVNDGRRNLYSSTKLPFDNRIFKCTLENDARSKVFDVYVKEADPCNVRMEQVWDFFSGQLNYTPYEAIQALDIALRFSATTRFTAVGRNFFSNTNSVSLGEGSELWFGYHQALRPTQSKLTLNIDMAATAFIEAASAIDFMCAACNMRDVPRELSPIQHRAIAKAFKSVKIQVTHRQTKRSFKINGITKNSAAETMFKGADGAECSIADYFAKTYSPLKYPGLPCIHVGAKNGTNYLPLEVCRVYEGQKLPKKVSDNQVASMIRYTCTKPEERRRKILEQVNTAHFETDNCLAGFGATINQSMLAVEARILPDPELLYANNAIERPRDGAWNLRGKGFYQGSELRSFAILNLCDGRSEGEIGQFFRALVNQLGQLNMKGPQGAPPIISRQGRGGSIEELFGIAIDEATRAFGIPPQVVFSVNPTTCSTTYGDVKRASDITFGIPSQCMLLKHIGKKSPQYIANILLKVNMKLGGKNSICSESLPKVSEVPTIIFGCDVSHPGPGDKSRPSIASCVATMDRYACYHAATVRKQGHRVDIIEDLEGMVHDLLRRFYQETQLKPLRVLVYRDGVSEGQFQHVLAHEIAAIRRACAKLEEGYNPQITFVVVQKRHHTRIFPTQQADADRSGNSKAGTVVDTGCCHPTEYDFYLMSHSGIQGCSRPAHYHVLLDEIQFTPDELQNLTYRLCYTFARCTRAVSVVPAVYYSQLVGDRARLFLQESSDGGSTIDGSFVESTGRMMDVHRNLSRVMYYV
ncbi:Argonaute1 (AGO1) [Thraustotheca clavata]|uniref:Argonaute1 (AGO1) n=1 Tax=Thraustotheca clavata TaxID=74557 RepID=A0A1W0A226_9STRA|nr:Argonaute1 (AGO1) [Thraustotheca clavata]